MRPCCTVVCTWPELNERAERIRAETEVSELRGRTGLRSVAPQTSQSELPCHAVLLVRAADHHKIDCCSAGDNLLQRRITMG